MNRRQTISEIYDELQSCFDGDGTKLKYIIDVDEERVAVAFDESFPFYKIALIQKFANG